MLQRFADKRAVWFVLGVFAGLAVASIWPKEEALAVGTDRDAQFALTTCQVSVLDPLEAIFVLDFLTGSLKGAVMNRQAGAFTSFYFRNLAADFQLDPKKEARWSIITGQAQLAARGGASPAQSVIYVGELTTGKINCYGFSWRETPRPTPPQPLTPVAMFPFREPDVGE